MRIRFDLKIIFFLFIFYFTGQIYFYIIIMGVALLHEIAHLFVGIILGFKFKQIEVMPIGFYISMTPNIDDYKKRVLKSNLTDIKKILVAIAGPLLNILCIILFSKWNRDTITYSNIIVLLLNIIPIYPLDGGRIIKCTIRIFSGKRIADIITNFLSNAFIILLTICGSIGILYWKNVSILIILVYLWNFVIKENKRYEIKKRIWNADLHKISKNS